MTDYKNHLNSYKDFNRNKILNNTDKEIKINKTKQYVKHHIKKIRKPKSIKFHNYITNSTNPNFLTTLEFFKFYITFGEKNLNTNIDNLENGNIGNLGNTENTTNLGNVDNVENTDNIKKNMHNIDIKTLLRNNDNFDNIILLDEDEDYFNNKLSDNIKIKYNDSTINPSTYFSRMLHFFLPYPSSFLLKYNNKELKKSTNDYKMHITVVLNPFLQDDFDIFCFHFRIYGRKQLDRYKQDTIFSKGYNFYLKLTDDFLNKNIDTLFNEFLQNNPSITNSTDYSSNTKLFEFFFVNFIYIIKFFLFTAINPIVLQDYYESFYRKVLTNKSKQKKNIERREYRKKKFAADNIKIQAFNNYNNIFFEIKLQFSLQYIYIPMPDEEKSWYIKINEFLNIFNELINRLDINLENKTILIKQKYDELITPGLKLVERLNTKLVTTFKSHILKFKKKLYNNSSNLNLPAIYNIILSIKMSTLIINDLNIARRNLLSFINDNPVMLDENYYRNTSYNTIIQQIETFIDETKTTLSDINNISTENSIRNIRNPSPPAAAAAAAAAPAPAASSSTNTKYSGFSRGFLNRPISRSRNPRPNSKPAAPASRNPIPISKPAAPAPRNSIPNSKPAAPAPRNPKPNSKSFAGLKSGFFYNSPSTRTKKKSTKTSPNNAEISTAIPISRNPKTTESSNVARISTNTTVKPKYTGLKKGFLK